MSELMFSCDSSAPDDRPTRRRTPLLILAALTAALVVAPACKRGGSGAASGADEEQATEEAKPRVVVTTTMLTDLTKTLAGEHFTVFGIMRPGGDPHLYQPTPADAREIARSQLVITSGLHLEGWIEDLVKNAGGERPIVVASDGVEPIRMEEMVGGVDPHFWFDLTLWETAAENVADALVELAGDEAEVAADVRAALDAYIDRTRRVHAWTRAQLATIDPGSRVLITSHDAFNYFGKAYDIEVLGIQGISTEQEASQRDVANVVELIRSRGVPAVFVESSVNPQLIEQVARETGVTVAGPLYSDSIGAADSEASTFLSTLRVNTQMITEALGGTVTPFAEATPQ